MKKKLAKNKLNTSERIKNSPLIREGIHKLIVLNAIFQFKLEKIHSLSKEISEIETNIIRNLKKRN